MFLMIVYLALFLSTAIIFIIRKIYILNKKVSIKSSFAPLKNYFSDRTFFYRYYKKLSKKNLVVHYYVSGQEHHQESLFSLNFVNNFAILNINVFNFEKNKSRIKINLNRYKRISRFKALFAIFLSHKNSDNLSKKDENYDGMNSISIFAGLHKLTNSVFPQKIKVFHLFSLDSPEEKIESFNEYFEAEISHNFLTISNFDGKTLDSQRDHPFFNDLMNSFIAKSNMEIRTEVIFRALSVCSEIRNFYLSFVQEKIDYLKENIGIYEFDEKDDVLIFKNLNGKKSKEKSVEDISDIVHTLDMKNGLSVDKIRINPISFRFLGGSLLLLFHFALVSILIIKSFIFIHNNKKSFVNAFETSSIFSPSEDKFCLLPEVLDPLKQSSFSYPVFIPSWGNKFDEELKNKIYSLNDKIYSSRVLNEYLFTTTHMKEYLLKNKTSISSLNEVEKIYYKLSNAEKIYKKTNFSNFNHTMNDINNFIFDLKCQKKPPGSIDKKFYPNKEIQRSFNDSSQAFNTNLEDTYFLVLDLYTDNILNFTLYDSLTEGFVKSLDSLSVSDLNSKEKNIEDVENYYEKIKSLIATNSVKFSNFDQFKYTLGYEKFFHDLDEKNVLSQKLVLNLKTKFDSKFRRSMETIFSRKSLVFNEKIYLKMEDNREIINPSLEKMIVSIKNIKSVLSNFEDQKSSYFSEAKSSLDPNNVRFVANILSEINIAYSQVENTQISTSALAFFNKFVAEATLKVSYPLILEISKFQNSTIPQSDLILLQANFKTILDSLSAQKIDNNFVQLIIAFLQKNYNANFVSSRTILEGKNVYMFLPSVISAWDGKSTLENALLTLTPNQDIKSYILTQTKIISEVYYVNMNNLLTSYENLFPYLYSENKEYILWNGIKKYLNNTDLKTPVNNINDFLLTMSPKINMKNCYQTLTQVKKNDDNDYFNSIYNNIVESALRRCVALHKEIILTRYNILAKKFNTSIANNFPFVGSENNNSKTDNDLPLETYQDFFDQFNSYISEYDEMIAKESIFPGTNSGPIEFINELKSVNNIIHVEESKESKQLQCNRIDLKFNFRSDKLREELADQIYSWKLFSNDKENLLYVASLKNEGSLSWQCGDPINFFIKLANSSEYNVGNKRNKDDKIIPLKEIYFNENSIWSLFHFISQHPDCSDGNTCKEASLKFEIPLQEGKKILFFSTLYLKDKSSKKYVSAPYFPSSAPTLIEGS